MALTDFFQMIIIVVGMTIAAFYVVDLPGAGGAASVIREASLAGKFDLFPNGFSLSALVAILVAVLTMGF